MADSDSQASSSDSSEQATNALGQPISSPNNKPTPFSPQSSPFDHNGKQLRSTGVLCTPELVNQAIKDVEAKVVKVDRFASLPDNVFKSILDWGLEIEMQKLEKAVSEADKTLTGWIPQSKLILIRSARKARHGFFRRMLLVSRRFYHCLRPSFYETIDLSFLTDTHYYNYSGYTRLGALFARKTAILLPGTSNENGAEKEGGKTAEPGTAAQSNGVASDGPPPRKKKRLGSTKKQAQVVATSKALDKLPTFGELVKTLVVGSYENLQAYIDTWLGSLPNLQHIFFAPKTNLSLGSLINLPTNVNYNLRSVDHLHLTASGEDAESRVEAILSLFNAAPNIERFGISGNFVLDELRGKRLSFIWKLNARLKHSPTGCLGLGLKQLYLGNGVEVTVSFLRNLKLSCPRLIKLHITAGVKVVIDTTPNGGNPFDLAAFATQWSDLVALTLVGTDTFSTAGTLDAVLKVCPSLTHLHLRADHITYALFASIANDLAENPVPQQAPASRANGAETSASAALVEASKRKKRDKTGLKHPLKHLAITCKVGDVNAKGMTIHIAGCNILPFSLLMLSFQARGLEYPEEIGGQRDLLSRAALMINLENKKQRDQKKREKDEEQKRMSKASEKGKEKEVEIIEVGGDEVEEGEEAILDVDISTEA